MPARRPRSCAPSPSASSAPGRRASRKPGSTLNKAAVFALALAATLAFGQPAKSGTYRGSGVVVATDRDMGRVTIEVEPVEALKLPALALAFIVYDERVWSRVQRGRALDFEFIKQGNNYVLLRVLKPTP